MRSAAHCRKSVARVCGKTARALAKGGAGERAMITGAPSSKYPARTGAAALWDAASISPKMQPRDFRPCAGKSPPKNSAAKARSRTSRACWRRILQDCGRWRRTAPRSRRRVCRGMQTGLLPVPIARKVISSRGASRNHRPRTCPQEHMQDVRMVRRANAARLCLFALPAATTWYRRERPQAHRFEPCAKAFASAVSSMPTHHTTFDVNRS